MEKIAKVEMSEGFYNSLPKEIRDGMELKTIYYPQKKYEENEGWKELKKESNKIYKKLKRYEYELDQK